MENFTYSAPTRYVFGRDAELQAGQQALMSDMKRVLVVFGHESARKSGLLDRVEKSLSDAGVFFMELGGIDPNPTDPKVREGRIARLFQKSRRFREVDENARQCRFFNHYCE